MAQAPTIDITVTYKDQHELILRLVYALRETINVLDANFSIEEYQKELARLREYKENANRLGYTVSTTDRKIKEMERVTELRTITLAKALKMYEEYEAGREME